MTIALEGLSVVRCWLIESLALTYSVR